MRATAIITSFAVLAAQQAVALSPPWAVCDNADGSRSEFMLLQSKTGEPRVVSFEIYAKGDNRGKPEAKVVVHCESRKAVSWVPESMTDRGNHLLDKMLNGDKPVTLRAMQRKLKSAGVKARYGTMKAGICACDQTSYYNSF